MRQKEDGSGSLECKAKKLAPCAVSPGSHGKVLSSGVTGAQVCVLG